MKKLLSLFALATFLLNSCSSPLSDLPISDPGLITPVMKITHLDVEDGVSSHSSVCLMDKNGAYIELKEGFVSLNDQTMNHHISCYSGSIDAKELKEYEFNITLADSVAYISTVVMPSFFKKVKYPSKIKPEETFEVSWQSDANNEETSVSFSVQDSTGQWINIFTETTLENITNIDPDNYPAWNFSKGKISLSKTRKGEMVDRFNGGSVTAVCIFERIVHIK